jgi:hypothetical protein
MTESPFSLTIKVGKNNDLLTGRAESATEMLQRIHDLHNLVPYVEGALQGVATPVTQAPAPVTNQVAVDNLNAGGLTGQITQGNESSIEMKEDRFGGKYMRGNPDAGSCDHGARIVKDWVTKKGKTSKAYVCVNDSPFGDWRSDKCDLQWAS